MDDRQTRAVQILDYWIMMELLGQQAYEDNTGIKQKMQDRKAEAALGAVSDEKQYQYWFTVEIKPENQEKYDQEYLQQVIDQEKEEAKLPAQGKQMIYLGLLERQECIEKIISLCPNAETEEIEEKSKDRIALASLIRSAGGVYEKGSFSLSPVVWALYQMSKNHMQVSNLRADAYRADCESIEEQFFDPENMLEKKKRAENKGAVSGDDTLKVNMENLQELYDYLDEVYLMEIFGSDHTKCEEVYNLLFNLYSSETLKNSREEEVEFFGLCQDYFSSDLQMVRSSLIDDEEEDIPVKQAVDVTSYILAIDPENQYQRTDVVNPKENSEKAHQVISKIMRIENAPLGKWPSRFMPAFMQQMAVNCAIQKNTDPDFALNGEIFSVNGPPGTGKTTLLKEIIVSNIVDRAVLLSKYEHPDDAFEAHNFINGQRDDGDATTFYDRYIRYWYSFENDRINDYGILVTSCNNAAVENISRELPKAMAKDLFSLGDDSQELKEILEQTKKMFEPDAFGTSESVRVLDPKTQKYVSCTYQDLYFNHFAADLFGGKNPDISQYWGLIAAPLGKRDNVKKLYYSVLNPLDWNFHRANEAVNNRLEKYKKARMDFLKQLETVKQMQKEIEQIEQEIQKSPVDLKSIVDEHNEAVRQYREYQSEIESCQSNKEQLEFLHEDIKSDLAVKMKEKEDAAVQIENTCNEQTSLEYKIDEWKETLTQIEENTKKPRWFSSKSKEAYNESQIRREECMEIIENLNSRWHSLEVRKESEQYHEMGISTEIFEGKRKKADLQQQIEQLDQKISRMDQKQKQLADTIRRLKKEYEQSKDVTETAWKQSDDVSDCDAFQAYQRFYFDNLVSKDQDVSTKANVDNPWFSQRYNREREKLFALAMRLNREFVLSSKCVRANLRSLGMYWGLRKNEENKKVFFSEEDRYFVVPALFQTLFLLVPVISSTFASVGRMLSDVKIPGTIGMLVVDEAGQAQPQMAAGSLFRSRRAVIVGDPKQIDPVVTEDLKLLRDSIQDPVLSLYKDTTLSVQVFADQLNPIGTYYETDSGEKEWVGCPLLVHRRCISPMYDISNTISYQGIMKQQTLKPKAEKERKFISPYSMWVQTAGQERGSKDHFVDAQGEKVCELLETAFQKQGPKPSVYIISPFTSVVRGVKEYIESYCAKHPETAIVPGYILSTKNKCIGTVHTFQGKEADEVIFVMGCDDSSQASGAIGWVPPNIVNVAATRAKFRFYVVGDQKAWSVSPSMKTVSEILQAEEDKVLTA